MNILPAILDDSMQTGFEFASKPSKPNKMQSETEKMRRKREKNYANTIFIR